MSKRETSENDANSRMGKTALVTGAHGHVGSFLVNLLVEKGWYVVATDLPGDLRKKRMTKERVFLQKVSRKALPEKNVTVIPADLTDRDTVYPLLEGWNHDVIFHTASLYDYFASFEELKRVNVRGLLNLLHVYKEVYIADEGKNGERRDDLQDDDLRDDALHQARIRERLPLLVHWSTCGVYGEPVYEHWLLPATESAPFNPPNNYSRSKVMQELLLQRWGEKHGLPYTIIRPAPIYGPYQTYGMFHVFNLFNGVRIQPIIHLKPPTRNLRMPMVHVKDVARAALFLATIPRNLVIGEVFNVIADCRYQHEFATVLGRFTGVKQYNLVVPWWLYHLVGKIVSAAYRLKNNHYRKKGGRPRFDTPMVEYVVHQYHFSNEKIKRLGFKFEYPGLLRGLKETLEWYRSRGWLCKSFLDLLQ